MTRFIQTGGLLVLAAVFLVACQPANDDSSPQSLDMSPMDPLQVAIDHPDRPESQKARDDQRHPFETLQFFGITPEMRVIELSPGGGWYSEILARYLKDDGQLIAAHWDLDGDVSDMYRRVRGEYETKFANEAAFGQVQIIPFAPPNVVDLGEPGSADMVLSFRNMHSWQRASALPAVFDAAYEVLKSGGVLGIVGHRLPEERPQDPEARSGYVHQSHVVALAEASGFELAEASEINANPADTADHPNGVWNLPPSLRVAEGDDKDYAAIGESDRFTLKFIKP